MPAGEDTAALVCSAAKTFNSDCRVDQAGLLRRRILIAQTGFRRARLAGPGWRCRRAARRLEFHPVQGGVGRGRKAMPTFLAGVRF
jgi:hypothetical protein